MDSQRSQYSVLGTATRLRVFLSLPNRLWPKGACDAGCPLEFDARQGPHKRAVASQTPNYRVPCVASTLNVCHSSGVCGPIKLSGNGRLRQFSEGRSRLALAAIRHFHCSGGSLGVEAELYKAIDRLGGGARLRLRRQHMDVGRGVLLAASSHECELAVSSASGLRVYARHEPRAVGGRSSTSLPRREFFVGGPKADGSPLRAEPPHVALRPDVSIRQNVVGRSRRARCPLPRDGWRSPTTPMGPGEGRRRLDVMAVRQVIAHARSTRRHAPEVIAPRLCAVRSGFRSWRWIVSSLNWVTRSGRTPRLRSSLVAHAYGARCSGAHGSKAC